MWCLNCGRKQPPKAGYCQFCGETKEVFSAQEPKIPNAVFARNLNLQSAAYYFMVLSGLLLVMAEIVKVAVYVFNLVKLILSEEIVLERFDEALTVQQPFASVVSVVGWIAVALLGVSMVVAGVFTKTTKRKALGITSGALVLLWTILDLAGVTEKLTEKLPENLHIDFVIIAMLLSIPMIVGFFGHPYLSKSAIGAVIRIVLATVALYVVPVLFDYVVDVVFGMIKLGDFTELVDPFVAVTAIVVIAVTRLSAASRMALFFSQLPDLCHPRRMKKVPVPKRQQQVNVSAPSANRPQR